MPVPEGQTGLRPYVDGAGHDIRLAGTRPVGPRLLSGRPYELTALQDLEVHLSPSWAATPHPTPARGALFPPLASLSLESRSRRAATSHASSSALLGLGRVALRSIKRPSRAARDARERVPGRTPLNGPERWR